MNLGSGMRTFILLVAVITGLSMTRIERIDDGSGAANTGNVVAGPAEDFGGPVEEVEESADAGSSGSRGGNRQATGGNSGGRSGAAANVGGSGVVAGPSTQQGAGGPGEGGAVECAAGKNGGSTAPGVTGTEIKLRSTAVLDGEAASLLKDSVTSIKAVFDKVNQAGGICGRRLSFQPDNDGFEEQRGRNIIKNYIDSGDVFALPVVPSAEGLGAAIQTGLIEGAAIPVVGSDGMRREQYGDPWVWPVATSTTSAMRIMAKYGYEQKNAKTFAIVYDSKYKFGIEGKNAFVEQVKALGGEVKVEEDLDPDRPSYGGEVDSFNGKCGGGQCDMVAMLLLPDTAKKWVAKKPEMGRLYTAGAQTLFTDGFARDCVRELGSRCSGFEVWTGYNPPVGALATKPGIATYVDDVRAKDPGIDVNNQFVQGAYLGASLFVEALQKVGPQLTREGLRDVLDSMTYQTDLASPLEWRPGNHRANIRAQSFAMSVSQNTFQGWGTGSGRFVEDPNPGAG